jgi:hypothetical protein
MQEEGNWRNLLSFKTFGFPKENREETKFAKEALRDFAELHTRRNDPILNSYNAGVILTWRANIDFRPVINREAVIAYVAKYASKADSQSSSYESVLQTAISRLKDTDASGIAYQKMLSTFAAERDVSAQETCHILLGCKLTRSSRPPPRSLCVDPDSTSGMLNFENGQVDRFSVLDRYGSLLFELSSWLLTLVLQIPKTCSDRSRKVEGCFAASVCYTLGLETGQGCQTWKQRSIAAHCQRLASLST